MTEAEQAEAVVIMLRKKLRLVYEYSSQWHRYNKNLSEAVKHWRMFHTLKSV